MLPMYCPCFHKIVHCNNGVQGRFRGSQGTSKWSQGCFREPLGGVRWYLEVWGALQGVSGVPGGLRGVSGVLMGFQRASGALYSIETILQSPYPQRFSNVKECSRKTLGLEHVPYAWFHRRGHTCPFRLQRVKLIETPLKCLEGPMQCLETLWNFQNHIETPLKSPSSIWNATKIR